MRLATLGVSKFLLEWVLEGNIPSTTRVLLVGGLAVAGILWGCNGARALIENTQAIFAQEINITTGGILVIYAFTLYKVANTGLILGMSLPTIAKLRNPSNYIE